MSLIAASAITAGAGLANSIIGNTSAKKAAKRQYKYQLALQQQNQDWQEKISNTAHQREVADLKAAGLNPVLSANNGANAGSGGVGSASMAQTQAPDLNEAINTAMQMKLNKKQLEQMDENIKNTQQNTNTAKAQEKLYKSETDLNKQTEEINQPDEETSKALKWWNSTWVGKGINVAGDVIKKITPFTDNYATAANANSARRISKSKRYK